MSFHNHLVIRTLKIRPYGIKPSQGIIVAVCYMYLDSKQPLYLAPNLYERVRRYLDIDVKLGQVHVQNTVSPLLSPLATNRRKLVRGKGDASVVHGRIRIHESDIQAR